MFQSGSVSEVGYVSVTVEKLSHIKTSLDLSIYSDADNGLCGFTTNATI